MGYIKTTISLQKPLFEQAEALARKMKISRSCLFALALEDYLQRQQNRDLLAQINAAYAGEPDPSEEAPRYKSRHTHRSIVEHEW